MLTKEYFGTPEQLNNQSVSFAMDTASQQPRIHAMAYRGSVIVCTSTDLWDSIPRLLQGRSRDEIFELPYLYGQTIHYVPDNLPEMIAPPQYDCQLLFGDEIEALGNSFNFMLLELDHYIHDLTAMTAEKERISAELDVATHIQSSMLPCIFPAFPERGEFDIYATMNPAKEVGGDFYDFFMVDERHLAIVMADVSGKGVPAALFMVIGKTLIKDHTQSGTDLGSVFSEVNDLLCESNSEGLFITAFEGVLDLVTGEFTFVNAGHEIPFIAKSGEPFAPYKIQAGFVLAGMEEMNYRCGSLNLAPGDKIFQYTDGVTEATDANEQLYGMERLEAVLNRNTGKKPEELLPLIKADIDAFVGEAPQFDDITMLCLEFKHYMRNRSSQPQAD